MDGMKVNKDAKKVTEEKKTQTEPSSILGQMLMSACV